MRAKLIFLTIVTMFMAASVAAPRHPEIGSSNAEISVTKLPPARGTTMPVRDLWMATMLNDASETARRENYQSPISDEEAIEIALQKGEAIAATRGTETSYQPTETAVETVEEAPSEQATEEVVAAVEATETVATTVEVAEDPAAPIWTVTGDRVNLRAGPGTEHDIVGVASAGDAVTPLSGIGTEWVEIERADGSLAWIFAKFVEPSDT